MEEKKNRKRRGKPQDRTKLTRNRVVQIRLTEDEVTRLKAAAAAEQMTLADFVMAGLGEPRRIVLPGGGQIWSELVKEGRNLNMALRLCNFAMKDGAPLDLQQLNEAAANVLKAQTELSALVSKWDLEISEKVKEVSSDADSEV